MKFNDKYGTIIWNEQNVMIFGWDKRRMQNQVDNIWLTMDDTYYIGIISRIYFSECEFLWEYTIELGNDPPK